MANTDTSFFYVGLDLGQGYYDNGGNPESYNSTRNRLAGGIHLGYQYNFYLSSEVAYQYLGHPYARYNDGEIAAHFHQGVLSARLRYPITENLSPYIKLGGSSWYGETSGLNDRNAGGFSPIWGAGLSYAVTERLSIRYEYQFTQSIGDQYTGFSDHRLMTLGISWRFNKKPKKLAPIKREIVTKVIVEQPVIEKKLFITSGYESDTLFANNSSQLIHTAPLQKAVDFLQTYPQTSITITGYTDSLGSKEYNLSLSKRRAQSVADYFIKQGINLNRIKVEGKGETEPISNNDTLSGRAMNRRVEMMVELSAIQITAPLI